jgi:hypothetical protein
MLIELRRRRENPKSTVGDIDLDGERICVTLEDAHHDPKIPGKTRIPAGEYKIELRTVGGFHERYLKRFGEVFHKGMLWLQDVPNFKFILIHCGNDVGDTEGCILVGRKVILPDPDSTFTISESEKAYRDLYPALRDALLNGADVFIQVTDPEPVP